MFENTFFISLIGFLVVLTPLVFIHELGHYLAAVKNGVIVEQFSVGFGPESIKLWSHGSLTKEPD